MVSELTRKMMWGRHDELQQQLHELECDMAEMGIDVSIAKAPRAASEDTPNRNVIVDYFNVDSDTKRDVVYFVTVFEDGTASCTCANYVRGNKQCKHIDRYGYPRHDGITTPANADLPYDTSRG
jgi:hypothetical protein